MVVVFVAAVVRTGNAFANTRVIFGRPKYEHKFTVSQIVNCSLNTTLRIVQQEHETVITMSHDLRRKTMLHFACSSTSYLSFWHFSRKVKKKKHFYMSSARSG